MLRQLARLTRPVGSGSGALAFAVYTDPAGRLVPARESGFEGVACVDDAARALDVLCGVWLRTRDPGVERWARGVLEFVLSMQVEDGRWCNFVYDWTGARNETGRTSSTGENFWHARALCGLSHAWIAFGDERALSALRRGLEHTLAQDLPADVRALHLLVGLRLVGTGPFRHLTPSLRTWAQEIAACRDGDVLMNSRDERGAPHLWAHVQEGVLADAGRVLDDRSLVEVAARSANALWVPIVDGGFDLPSVTPYDVACAISSLEGLARADDADWTGRASAARTWFDRHDDDGRAVYDRVAGRVADGVDAGRVSRNSGAEANIVAAEAMLDEAVRHVREAVAALGRRWVMRT